ncbi:hypothetical protein V5O48_005342 [Marasmius crinis-equi]|uniref:DRBM domain-containing protein n=1 Tax=Marasmius crinis-equi TaxID=585013 RepID=A0ABR3FMI9_9AGAR
MDDPFNVVSLNFERIGAVPVEEYLSSSKYDSLEVNYAFENLNLNPKVVRKALDRLKNGDSQLKQVHGVEEGPEDEVEDSADVSKDSLELLKSKCQTSFPKSAIDDILKWNFDKDSILLRGGKHTTWRGTCCSTHTSFPRLTTTARLTICKPTGEMMSVNSCQSMSTATAQNDAARRAIESGALDFIIADMKSEDCSTDIPATAATQDDIPMADLSVTEPAQGTDREMAKKKKRKKSQKREAATQERAEQAQCGDAIVRSSATPTSCVTQIETLFSSLGRPDSVLRWYQWHTDQQHQDELGFALLVKLSNSLYRVYCTASEPEHDTVDNAREECARVALKQGFSDFIKSSKDLPVEPFADTYAPLDDTQQFFESMDSSFRENFAGKTVQQIQPVQRLNDSLKRTKGSRLLHSFHLIKRAGDNRWSGYVLRFEREGETKAYILEPCFRKHKDARAAVCLQAMSQGAEEYLRRLHVEVESRVTEEMKILAKKIRPVLQPANGNHTHEITHDLYRDAHGATITLQLDPHSSGQDRKEYTVPCEYASNAHAQVAVLCLAAQLGAIEFVQFRGRNPPPGYVTALAKEAAEALANQKKRSRLLLEVEPGQVDEPKGAVLDGKKKKMKAAATASTPGTRTAKQGSLPQFAPPFPLSAYPEVFASSGHSFSTHASGPSVEQTSVIPTPGLSHPQELMRLRANVQMSRVPGSSQIGASSSHATHPGYPSQSTKRSFTPGGQDSDKVKKVRLS